MPLTHTKRNRIIQAQLLSINLNPRDKVFTPDDVARDVVNFFKPTGRILEPSAGDGAFLRHLPPDTDWCEIEKGRDFFACHEHYDWIIGNPPYSLLEEWLEHSFQLADDVVYVLLFHMVFSTKKRLQKINQDWGIRKIYVLGSAKEIGMADFGFLCAAFHFQRGYKGGMYTIFRGAENV